MEGQNKHFSHTHNLSIHQIPEGTQITCAGCNTSGTGIVYVCWQCNFFLHEQCFQASRSLKHPSHPSHPLTLAPFPTYPSTSFVCNYCNEIGTAFSYSCSHCEFDLHVQCACVVSFSSHLTPQTHNPCVPIPTYPPSKPDLVKAQAISHFSHPHDFQLVNPKAEDDSTQCSVCEEIISGSRYSCSESSCNFHLDKTCFNLPQHILHKSHPEHPLILISNTYYESGQFTCNACYNAGSGFTYHCATCAFDLHIKCSSLPEIVKRADHEHPLKLLYSSPVKGKDYNFVCDVCHGIVQENSWTYYCEMCEYGTHLDCVNCEEKPAKESGSLSGDPLLEAQLQMQMLQINLAMANQNAQSFQVGMAHQNAQMVMSMSQSFHASSSNIKDSI